MQEISIKLKPQVEKVFSILRAQGFEAFLVGGYIRDCLLGKESEDIDITTNAKPQEIIQLFNKYKVIETGLKHGTLTVVIESVYIEITTYRIDLNYIDARRPEEVIFTKELKEDLARRDFTINAIAYNPKEGLIDYFDGIDDLNNGVIRCIGEASDRFKEDALRILRALRFSSTLGFKIEEKTQRAILKEYPLLAKISSERILSELYKIITGKNAKEVLLNYPEVITFIIPELKPSINFNQQSKHHKYDVYTHVVLVLTNIKPLNHLRLAALLHDIAKPECFSLDSKGAGHFYNHEVIGEEKARVIMNRLRVDNLTKSLVCQMVRYHMYPLKANKKIIKKALKLLGEDGFYNVCELKKAELLAKETDEENDIEEILAIAKQIILDNECFSLKDLAIDGSVLINLGFKGPVIGKMLNEILELVVNGDLNNDNAVLIEWVNKTYKSKDV